MTVLRNLRWGPGTERGCTENPKETQTLVNKSISVSVYHEKSCMKLTHLR